MRSVNRSESQHRMWWNLLLRKCLESILGQGAHCFLAHNAFVYLEKKKNASNQLNKQTTFPRWKCSFWHFWTYEIILEELWEWKRCFTECFNIWILNIQVSHALCQREIPNWPHLLCNTRVAGPPIGHDSSVHIRDNSEFGKAQKMKNSFYGG